MLAVYILGSTCAGKTTTIDSIVHSEPSGRIGSIKVGQILRERYPPGHFKGKAWLPETEAEAMTIYNQGMIEKFYNEKLDIVLIDGQPRSRDQIRYVLDNHVDVYKHFILLHCSRDSALERAAARFPCDSESYNLSLDRIKNDAYDILSIICELRDCNQRITCFQTDKPGFYHGKVLSDILAKESQANELIKASRLAMGELH